MVSRVVQTRKKKTFNENSARPDVLEKMPQKKIQKIILHNIEIS